MKEAERAVYELLELGPMSRRRSVIYRRPLAALAAARLVRKTPDGGHELVTREPRGIVPRVDAISIPPADVVTFQACIPREYAAVLDRMGCASRSDALCVILSRLAGSGTWRKT